MLKNFSLLALLFLATSATAQEQHVPRDGASVQRPTLLVVGSGHLANPGRDTVNIQIEDITTPARQREIEAVVDQLAAFHPTHVAVERRASDQAMLDERYVQYRAGKYTLGKGEQEQIGMRLAAKLGLPRVDAVDWNGNPPGPEASYDWEGWGKAHGFADQLAAITDPARIPFHALGKQSVAEWLLAINRPETLLTSYRQYYDIARVGAGEDQPGAAWVGTWYARNLRIFNNLLHIASKPDDRVVVIYGAGHAYLLRQMARESGAVRLVDANQVLKPR